MDPSYKVRRPMDTVGKKTVSAAGLDPSCFVGLRNLVEQRPKEVGSHVPRSRKAPSQKGKIALPALATGVRRGPRRSQEVYSDENFGNRHGHSTRIFSGTFRY